MSRDTLSGSNLHGLTPRQADVLRLIVKLEEACEAVTSTRLADELGLARQNLREHLLALRGRGFIQYEAQARQTAVVRLTPRSRALFGVGGYPLVGEVAAGRGVYAEQNVERFVTNLEDLLDLREGDFLLRVRGDSMIGAGIFEGDIVAIRPSQEEPPSGEIVLALVPGEGTATLKRWQRAGEDVLLVAENSKYAPMRFHVADVQLQGCLIGHVGQARPRRVVLP